MPRARLSVSTVTEYAAPGLPYGDPESATVSVPKSWPLERKVTGAIQVLRRQQVEVGARRHDELALGDARLGELVRAQARAGRARKRLAGPQEAEPGRRAAELVDGRRVAGVARDVDDGGGRHEV